MNRKAELFHHLTSVPVTEFEMTSPTMLSKAVRLNSLLSLGCLSVLVLRQAQEEVRNFGPRSK